MCPVITDTFRQLNKSMHGDDPAAYRIPESQELAAQYLLLYELSLPQGPGREQPDRQVPVGHAFVDIRENSFFPGGSRTECTCRDMAEGKRSACGQREQHWSRSTVRLYRTAQHPRHGGRGRWSCSWPFPAILLFALRSLRLGLISIVPNMIPAVLGFGVWGLTVGQVGLSLSVVAAMTIGIIVDDTVHFLSKYRRARHEYGQDPEEAVRHAFDTAGRSVFTTTVVLVAGFLILVFSPFVPTAQVGILTAMIIAFALVADLSLLPALLTAVDRRPTGRNAPAS